MKKLLTILAIITSILAITLAVLPASNLAIFPCIAALVFGIIAFYLSKKAGEVKKIIEFTFLLTVAALIIVISKVIFTEAEIANTDTLNDTETQLEQEAIQELEELEIGESDLEDISIEE